MNKTISLLILIFCFIATGYGQKKTMNIHSIEQYFSETKVATKKHQKLWDLDLYGPMLIVNPYTRMTYASYPDTLGILKKEGNVYVGSLPKGILLGNAVTNWGGRKWSMVLTVFISENEQDRIDLFSHELFHRVQPTLHFEKVKDGNNQHLDTKDGRIFLRLELAALTKALKTTSKKEKHEHVLNALKFRRYRYQLFPDAYLAEATIEINEGIASYTGKVHRGLKGQDISGFMESKIIEFLQQPSYVQLFAYQTVPAYGFMLAERNKHWNKEVNSNTNLTDYFNESFTFQTNDISEEEIDSIGKQYEMASIILEETDREHKKLKQIAEYKSKFIEQPHFTILFEKKRVAYDTRYIVTLENLGFVYPTLTANDNWGILEVKEVGGFLNQDKSSITITAPTTIEGRKISGEGWELTLNEGYELIKEEKSGNYTLKKIKEEK